MYCEGQCLGYEGSIPPCGCVESYSDPINIMWIYSKGRQSLTPNYIVPLVLDTGSLTTPLQKGNSLLSVPVKYIG